MNNKNKYFNFNYKILIAICLNVFYLFLFSLKLISNETKIESVLVKDTTNSTNVNKNFFLNNSSKEDIIPSSENQRNVFTAEQDTAYYRALRSNVTSNIRIWNDLNLTKYIWFDYLKNIKKSDVAIAMESITSLPKEYFLPDPKEVVQRQINIANSFYVPNVPTYDPMFNNNALFTFEEIGNFLGLTEDVSSEINYNLERTTNVVIVIYSIRAFVIAKIFDGVQPAGPYTINWNGRDDNGKKMPSGDYIAEIRIANEKYYRKRIIIP